MQRNEDKLWLQQTLNRVAIVRATEEIDRRGSALPCHVIAVNGSIVTVAFDLIGVTLPQITIPKAEDPYFRQPTQIGDKGVTQACDVYLGGVSGLGGGVADTTIRGNLSTLFFRPISNQGSPSPNPNACVVQGPDGAIIQTLSGTTSTIVVTPTGITMTYGSTMLAMNDNSITLTAGGETITLNSSGLDIGGILFGTHAHPYYPGTGAQTDTGGPV